MPALPNVGASTDTWGTELNEFLQVAHGSDGTLLTGVPNIRTAVAVYDDFDFGSTTSAFIGRLGWILQSGSTTASTPEAGGRTFIRLDTTAASGTVSCIHPRTNTVLFPADTFDALFLVRLNTNDANTIVRVGFAWLPQDDPPANGIYIEKLAGDTQWFGVTRAATVQTRTAALASCSTSWVRFRIRRVDASTVGFTVNGSSEVTATANIPTATIAPDFQIKNSAAASKTLDVDAFAMTISGLTR